MSGKIVEGRLNLSSEHEGYAWVLIETLPDYELADWLQDYVNQTRGISSSQESEDSENTLTPWINSIKSTVDKMAGKK